VGNDVGSGRRTGADSIILPTGDVFIEGGLRNGLNDAPVLPLCVNLSLDTP
jgi:hypothetical protein